VYGCALKGQAAQQGFLGLIFGGETHVAGLVLAYSGSLPYRNNGVAVPQLLSTKKSGSRRNSGVYALGDRSSQLGVGAELLAQADQEQGADNRVDVAAHVALLGRGFHL
jgi:hypothetical protein